MKLDTIYLIEAFVAVLILTLVIGWSVITHRMVALVEWNPLIAFVEVLIGIMTMRWITLKIWEFEFA